MIVHETYMVKLKFRRYFSYYHAYFFQPYIVLKLGNGKFQACINIFLASNVEIRKTRSEIKCQEKLVWKNKKLFSTTSLVKTPRNW